MYKKIKKTGIIIFFILVYLIIPSSIFMRAEAKENNDMQVSISYGYGENIKLGRFLPINIKISNIKKDISVKLDLEIDSRETANYEYTYPINLKKDIDYENTYSVFLDDRSLNINIDLYDDTGRKIYTEKVDLLEKSRSNSLIIGLLSDSKEDLSYFNKVKLNYGLIETTTVDLSTDNFPLDSINLQQLDIIVISSYRIRDLSYEKSMVLMDWVKNGGIIIMGTGKRVDDTLGRYAPELLDDMYDKPYLKTVNFKVSNKADKFAQIYVLDLLIHGGNIILSDEDIPLISSVNKENGQIIVAAFDFVDISPYMEENDEYISNFLTKAIGVNKLENISNSTYNEDSTAYFDIKAVLSVPDFNKTPNLGLYFIIIFIYILFSGPVLYSILRQNNLLTFYTRALLIISICFSIIIYIFGNTSRYKKAFYTAASIKDVNEDYTSNKTFVNISSPYNKPYKINIDKSYSFRDIKDDDRITQNNIVSNNRVVLSNDEQYTNIEFLNNEAFESHIFNIEKREINNDKIGISASINLGTNTVSGYIENNYNYDLTSLSIIFYSKLIKIGDIKAGEKISLDDKKLINIPLTNHAEIAKYINKDIEKMEFSEDYILNFQRNNLLSFYMDNFLVGYTSDAKVLAFRKDNIGEKKLIPDLDGREISLIVGNINVDNKIGNDEIYRQALMKNPSVLSGEYYLKSNTFYAKEALILEYHLGEDIDIEELNFENISNTIDKNINMQGFKGQIYLYDYKKENFVKKDIEKNTYTKEELEPYLMEDNSIRVRYFNSDTSTSDMYLSLPMLSIVAKQK